MKIRETNRVHPHVYRGGWAVLEPPLQGEGAGCCWSSAWGKGMGCIGVLGRGWCQGGIVRVTRVCIFRSYGSTSSGHIHCHSERSEESQDYACKGGMFIGARLWILRRGAPQNDRFYDHSALRSSHLGFSDSMRATFLYRFHPFICFSRAIADWTSVVVSK